MKEEALQCKQTNFRTMKAKKKKKNAVISLSAMLS